MSPHRASSLLRWLPLAAFLLTPSVLLARTEVVRQECAPNTLGLDAASSARSLQWPDGVPSVQPRDGARSDTVQFGYYALVSGEAYAVVGETWTFDHGAPDPKEGWISENLTGPNGPGFRRITAAEWAGHGNTVSAPIIGGAASAWIGAYESEADTECWDGGLGYGNDWCQRWVSPVLEYSGAGSVDISFRYFIDAEPDYDFVTVRLVFDALHEVVLDGGELNGRLGNPGTNSYLTWSGSADAADFSGFTQFQLVLEFDSDGGYSDEDGGYTTTFGGFGIDDIALSGELVGPDLAYGFEGGAEGWSAIACSKGLETSQFGVAPLSGYNLPAICGCDLSGNVAELHDSNREHPYGQHERIVSPIIDRGSLGPSYNDVSARWDQYSDLPPRNGVFYRSHWTYFPFICPETGQQMWAPFEGQDTYFNTGDDPVCQALFNSSPSQDVPQDAALYRFALEVYASCDAFGVPPEVCTGQTNATPLFDNIRVLVAHRPAAPAIQLEPGGQFSDGFPFSFSISSTATGNADISYNLRRDLPVPARLGDSLQIHGPLPTSSTKWSARFWWRMRRQGPSQTTIPGYNAWKTAVSDGRNIVGAAGEFTFGWMDSLQLGTQVAKNRFISEFREDDDDFVGENTDNNEMIRDGMLTPGSQVEYFITSQYESGTESFYLPDTTGRNFLSFEILPSYRLDGGVAKFPTFLYLDANGGHGGAPQYFMEQALNVVLNGAAPLAAIPNPTLWDRFDLEDACSCWNAPFARSNGGNNGAPLQHLLQAYRTILIDTGEHDAALEREDGALFSDWLSTAYWCGNNNRQGLIVMGEALAHNLTGSSLTFLNSDLGVTEQCTYLGNWQVPGCGPSPDLETACIRIEDAAGALYPSDNSNSGGPDYQVDNWRKNCPTERVVSVLGTTNGGVGNRNYFEQDEVPPQTVSYSQVTKSVTGANSANYRAVFDAVSWWHLSERDPSEECVSDASHIIAGASNELRAALNWIYGVGNIPGLTNDFCGPPTDVAEGAILGHGPGSYLDSARPNPFNPRTTLRYALARAGRVEISIFDAGGRRLRTLVNATEAAGPHEVVWDGADGGNRPLPSGIYWVQMQTDDYKSNKKLIRLE